MNSASLRRASAPIGAVLLALAMGGCGAEEPPVGSLTVSPATIDLSYPGYREIELTFSMTEPLEGGRPVVFVHLLSEPGDVQRTFDHVLPGDWRAGSELTYSIVLLQSALAEPLEPGRYLLTAGLYREDRRWPLAVDGEEVDSWEYRVADVEVLENGSRAPMFHFSPAWLPTEGGTDAQVLGRRWLTAEGVLRLAQIQAPGTLRMAVNFPRAKADAEDLVIEEGHDAPGAVISSSCGGDEVSVGGFGEHVVEIPVRLDEEGALPEQCEIHFQPHARLVDRETLQTRAVLLEALSWSADE